MHISILGSGTCVPCRERSAACIKVVSGPTTVLLDSGPGSIRQMVSAGTTIEEIDLLCYTHLHIDHTADLAPLLFASKYDPHPRTRDLAIIAAPGFREFYNRLVHAYGDWIVPDKFCINWIDALRQPYNHGSLTITTTPVEHTQHSIAFRLQEKNGKNLVYSGDTDYCESLIELADESDVLILECSFPEGKRCKGHLTPELAGRIAAESRCKQLILTHFYPECNPQRCCDGAAKHFTGRIHAARDMLEINN